MSRYGWGYGYTNYPRESAAEKKEKAQKALIKLKKKQPDIQPVVIEGRTIARTWWGKAWNRNLESYADYESRLGRGRAYVKNGSILDLRIKAGHVAALVAGSGREPYRVEIAIAPLKEKTWERIAQKCGRSITSVEALAEGQFPKELETLFTQKGEGLFPTYNEIAFGCDCPDWANMCKHVAAVLYGIGARLDEDPSLFFKLRDIEMDALIKKSVEEKMEDMLKHAGQKTDRVIEDADLKGLFGV